MILLIAASRIETINTFIKKVLKYYVKNYCLFDLLLLFSCWVVSNSLWPPLMKKKILFHRNPWFLWKYLIRELHGNIQIFWKNLRPALTLTGSYKFNRLWNSLWREKLLAVKNRELNLKVITAFCYCLFKQWILKVQLLFCAET